ncbi:MAG: restriction endonuclease subunit S, partial [Gammaproteobacteria bacterium]|nr:restriction endonuclease subunit S [Gammaproteobacteria bacterium]
PRAGFNKEFLYYFYLSLDSKKMMKPLYKGLRNTIPKDNFYAFKTYIPSITEQTAIANFLDQKSAQIDQAIAIKEKQITLLKERKQILIQNAVTRGLNPDAPMRDSGVEWLGDVPAHWKTRRLKYIVKILKRIVGHEGPNVLSITQQGIKVKDIESGEGQLAMDYSKYQLLYQGEFAMNHMDLLTGYVDISKFDGVVSPDYRVFKNTSKEINDQYLLAIFQIGYKHRIFYRYGQGVSFLGRWRFPADNFNNFFIPIPPIEEQEHIVFHIEKESSKMDAAITLQQQQIEKLKEYKTTLINNAVTGKIKVA